MIPGREELVNFYSTADFDRAADRRADARWLEDRLKDPVTRIHVVWRGRTLVAESKTSLKLFSIGDHNTLIDAADHIVLLGIDNEAAHIAIDLSNRSEDWVGAFGAIVDLRSVGSLLPARDSALAALARGMTHWHSRHRYCGACGGPTRSEMAGHLRRCIDRDCGVENFPRIDPAVIMRIVHGDRILLGRQANWPSGMHSVLAGFVEPGEALEDAVRRETREEVGLDVLDVRYFGSQPWPFPSSLMVGFSATAAHAKLTIDRKEIDDARWFSREELRSSPENETFRLPRRDSIARRLVEDWLSMPALG